MSQPTDAGAAEREAIDASALPVGVFAADAKGKVYYVNPAILEMCGIDEEAIRSGTWIEQIDEEFRPAVKRAWGRLFSEHIGYELEYSVILPDGSKRWLLVKTECNWSSDGSFRGAVGTLTNITRHKQTEAQLELLSARNHALLATIPDIVAEVDNDRRYVWMNKAAKDFFGEDALGKSAEEFFIGVQDTYRQIDPLFSGDAESINVQSWQRRRDGEERLLDWHCRSIMDGSGKVVGALSSARDITDESEALTKLRESESRYRSVISSMGEGVIVMAADMTINYSNDAACQILGLSEDQIRGRTSADPRWHAVKADGSPFPAEEHPVMRSLQEGVECDGVFMGINQPSGEQRWISINSRPIYGPRGKTIIGSVATFKDETETKLANEALHRGQQTMLEAQRIANFGDWEWDIQTGDLRWSDQIYRIFGLKPQEFEASYEAFLNTIHSDDRQSVTEAVSAAVAGEAHYSIDHRIVLPDGQVRYVHEEGEVYRNANGEPIRMLGVVQDITTQKLWQQEIEQLNNTLEQRVIKRTDELLVAKEEAERASQAKSEFLSRMSHELRTPMNAVLGFSQILLADQREKLSERQRTSITKILDSGEHLLDLINDVLDLSRIDAGKLQVSIEETQLLPEITSALDLVAPQAREMGVALHFDEQSFRNVVVLADRIRLRQALLNLFSNAVKYNRKGGDVFIEVQREQEKEEITIKVRDTGIGIPESKFVELFEPFNRLHMDKSDIQGTGIGLTITRNVVDLMKGSISVTSEEGKGTTFFVTLPAADVSASKKSRSGTSARFPVIPEHSSDSSASQTSSPEDQAAKILYVEDNEMNAELVEMIVDSLFPSVDLTVASDAESGLEFLQSNRVDVILMDLTLPGMSGYEALEAIRSKVEYASIPVFAVTANALQTDRRKVAKAGFNGYMAKPIQIGEFEKLLKPYLRQES